MQKQQMQQGGRSPYHASQLQPETTPFNAATSDPRSSNMLSGGGVCTKPQPQHQQQQQQLKLGDPSQHQHQHLDAAGGVTEAASPISSRPPAIPHLSTAGNFEQLLPAVTSSGDVDDVFGGDEADRGGGGGASSGGNRWPRQETLALLKIRSEMDAAFRDATLKGPLWEDVSRRLAELGYKRSAKKCKEKFENVHKYYKRTKEGRAGRQDGKSYRFFSQLEALHSTTISGGPNTTVVSPTTSPSATVVTTDTTSVQVVSSVGIPLQPQSQVQAQASPGIGAFPLESNAGVAAPAPLLSGSAEAVATPPFSSAALGVSFSTESTSSSFSSGSEEDEGGDMMELEGGLEEGEPAPNTQQQRKRKRASSKHRLSTSSTGSERMMEFFEGLMKQVMQKQEAMQQRFLEAIEKREQDRMIREEAWKRQEMARLAREHDLVSQERAISASRDAAIIAFLQKITDQTIQLPPAVSIPAAPSPPLAVPVYQPPPSPPHPPPSSQQGQKPQQLQQPQHYLPQQQQLAHHQHRHQHPQQQLISQQQQCPENDEVIAKNQPAAPISKSEIVVAIPEQEVPLGQETSNTVGGSFEATSSRWPKAEVLVLIQQRSGLESRYLEAGPKGPLWEEISAGMHRMGYKRNAKRCKEKWENINKYFKKVKESNKKRPEDAKTCPYFHELDALYRKKILGSSSNTLLDVNQNRADQVLQHQVQETSMIMVPKIQERVHVPVAMPSPQTAKTTESENKDGSTTDLQKSNGGLTASLFGEGSDGAGGGTKKPEDIVEEQQPQNHQRQLMVNGYGDIEEPDSDNIDQEEDVYDDEDDDLDDDDEEEAKMAYQIQFQRQNTGSSNGGGSGAPSFFAMVQQ